MAPSASSGRRGNSGRDGAERVGNMIYELEGGLDLTYSIQIPVLLANNLYQPSIGFQCVSENRQGFNQRPVNWLL